jgi:peptidoglycan biosynthesis protein MviN/MurJ (putative lipid II flippase)
VVGSVAKLGTHLVGLGRELRMARAAFAWRTPAVKAMLLLMMPLIVGILVAKVRDNFNNVSVLSHLATEGLMQANSLGRKLYQPIGWLVPYALSIAMFPFFCELVDRDDHKQLGAIMTNSGRMLLSVFIPLAMVCAVLSRPITALLFYGGKFALQNVAWTSVSMACYTLVLPATALEYLLMQAFFANRRMVSVTVAGIVFSFLSMGISYLAVVTHGLSGGVALAAVAGGFAFSRTLKSTALIILLRRFTPCFPAGATASFLLRSLLVGSLSAGGALLARRGFEAYVSDSLHRVALLGQLATAGVGAAIGFVIGVMVLRVHEPRDMLSWALRKLHDRQTTA